MKRDIVRCSQLIEVTMIRDNRRNFYGQRTDTMPIQQIIETVSKL